MGPLEGTDAIARLGRLAKKLCIVNADDPVGVRANVAPSACGIPAAEIGMKLALCVGVVVFSLLSATFAAAQPDQSEDPEALIRTGVKLRQNGDDVRAEGYFRRAYRLAKTPRSAIQLGLVEFALKNYADAEIHLAEGMTSTDDAWVTSHRPVLEQTVAELRMNLGGVELVGGPTDATVTAGRLGPVRLADRRVIWVAPGTVALRVEAPGHKAETYSVTTVVGQTKKVTVALRPEPEAAAAATVASTSSQEPEARVPASGNRALRIGGLITAGAGVLAGVAGVVLYQVGSSKRQSIEEAAMNRTAYNESNGNWKTFDRAGMGLMIGGSVAAVTGGVLYVVGRRERSAEAGAQVALQVVPGLSLLQVGGRF